MPVAAGVLQGADGRGQSPEDVRQFLAVLVVVREGLKRVEDARSGPAVPARPEGALRERVGLFAPLVSKEVGVRVLQVRCLDANLVGRLVERRLVAGRLAVGGEKRADLVYCVDPELQGPLVLWNAAVGGAWRVAEELVLAPRGVEVAFLAGSAVELQDGDADDAGVDEALEVLEVGPALVGLTSSDP